MKEAAQKPQTQPTNGLDELSKALGLSADQKQKVRALAPQQPANASAGTDMKALLEAFRSGDINAALQAGRPADVGAATTKALDDELTRTEQLINILTPQQRAQLAGERVHATSRTSRQRASSGSSPRWRIDSTSAAGSTGLVRW